MMARVKAAAKRAFGLLPPRRELVIVPDDIFLVSFPKSGNTWTRFLIANLAHPSQQADFGNIHLLIPDPFATSKRDFDRMPRPRIIKSHECFDPRYPRVIYIVRDPRDVLLSQYHYHRKCRRIEDDYPIEKFVVRFIAGETCPHGSWGENVASWLTTRQGDPRFLLLKYEDMVADTCCELAKVSSFLGLPAGSEQVAEAVEKSSVNKMRELEKTQGDLNTLTKETRKDLAFVRAGKAGGWRDELTDVLVAEIEAAWGPLMNHLGYELNSQPGRESKGMDSVNLMLGGTPR